MPEESNKPALPASAEDSTSAPDSTPVERLIAQPLENVETTGMTEIARPIFSSLASARRRKPGGFLLFAGVLLPSLSVVIELASGMCAEEFFDPLPTVWHAIIVSFAPLANLYIHIQLRKDDFEYRPALGVMNGFVIVIAGVYTILYAPLLPLAVFALLVMGLGILPMAPLSALIAAILYARHLRRAIGAQREFPGVLSEIKPARVRGLGYGIACAIVVLSLAEGHRTITHIGMRMASSKDPQESLKGVRMLRSYGHEKTMLAACHWRNRQFGNFFGAFYSWGAPMTIQDAQTVYYRVTGKTYGSSGTSRWSALAYDSSLKDLDPDRTGELSDSVERSRWAAQHLALSSSRMDGSLDADAALGYLEWTMVFKNTAQFQQEAVSRIALPPGGVVSRLTLWVNGEEREAAFAAKGKVQAAYDAVVRTRRDPVLVTSLGGDVISVRCFPVQPDGEMKIRIGVTAPMQIEQNGEAQSNAWMRLPHFLERNFVVGESVTHSVWLESKQPLEASSQNLKPENPSANLFAVRGVLKHAELAGEFPSVRANRSALVTEAWTRDPFSASGEIIAQRIEPKSSVTPLRVVFVVDGSAGMRDFATPVADALARMPERGEFAALVASDEVVELEPMRPVSSANARDAATRLKQFDFSGGQDNVAALARAWDIASQKPDSVIVWIHEPQPVTLGEAGELRQRWERRPGSPRLFDLQTRKGTNTIAEELRDIAAVNSLTRMGNTSQEVERLLSRLNGVSRQFAVARQKLPAKQWALPANAKETSKHLARLWAFDEVTNLLARGDDKDSGAAVKLASNYQLVTPLTGAVVLETQEQYQQAGLEPVKPGTTPAIPEPEEWLLMLSVLLILAWMFYRRRFACGAI